MVLGNHVPWKTAPKTNSRLKIESLIYIKHRLAAAKEKGYRGSNSVRIFY